MMTAFPCNECQLPTTQSHHPDRWLCVDCGRKPPPPAEGKPAFAVEPNLLEREEMSVGDVIEALRGMTEDKRLTNEPVRAIFRRAHELLTAKHHDASAAPYRYELAEGQAKYRQSLMDLDVDPASQIGQMLQASFLAGWKVARAKGLIK